MEKQRVEKALDAVSQAQDDKAMDRSSAESALRSISAEETKTAVYIISSVKGPKIKINSEDVKLVMQEFYLDRDEAEKALIEHSGDVVATLTALVTA